MAEKIISPGVFTNEIDQTFLPAAVTDIGAALIGPTVKGPAGVPTIVTSFSDFQQKFGDVFKSGSNSFQFLTSHTAEQYLKNSDTLTVVRIMDGTFGPATANVPTGSFGGGDTPGPSFSNGDDGNAAFVLTTLSDGTIMNNSSSTVNANDLLPSGSEHNIRYEINGVNVSKGSFNLIIRRGDDSEKRKQVLETFNNVNLDPNTPNFIGKAVGTQFNSIGTDENLKPFIKLNGDFPNKSKFVRVSDIRTTIDYVDENGDVRLGALSASLPQSGSGSARGAFKGGLNGQSGFNALGVHEGHDSAKPANFYELIVAQTQGFSIDVSNKDRGINAYNQALDLLSNQDEYDVNLILTPGILHDVHSTITTKVIDVCEDRGDCFAIIDPVQYDKNVADATTEAEEENSNFAAMYWPWIKVPDTLVSGTQRWVPPSVVLGGIYAFNDKVAHPWFAPAGLNRGGIDVAIQAERKLTQADRDTLYDSNVNPIATFPGQGVTVFGQKTLQKKASALDRVNVRRLLIRVKKFIASSSRFLVFEQNTQATRRRFLSIVNPFLEQVQSQSGLNAFRVVMDETNNTPDTIDRNQLVGQLFLQPTRTAEFIVLDFTIQPTGASFPE